MNLAARILSTLRSDWEPASAIAARLGGVSTQRASEALHSLGSAVGSRYVDSGRGEGLKLRTEWRRKNVNG
jgi:hypothetical protein